MQSDLRIVLQDECQIDPERPVLVAVSGGADSLSISDFMHQEGFRITVAHFDHKLREESSADAEAVRKYARSSGLEFILGKENVRDRITQEGESLEEAARNARYKFLFKCAQEINAQAVITGHTADDQVETVLMHLLRGSGLGGLGGMSYRWLPNAWHTEIPLVRPLLGVWREEILSYCHENKLSPVVDSTNLDPAYFRNRLRLELIPYLETYNPAVRRLVWQTADILRSDKELIVESVDKIWPRILEIQGKDYVCIHTNLSREYSLGMQRHLIRKAIAQLRPGLKDISFEAVEIGIGQIRSSKPFAEVDLIAGLKMVSEPGKMWFAEWDAELPTKDWPQVTGDPKFLEPGDTVRLEHGWRLYAEITDFDVNQLFPGRDDKNLNQVWLDNDGIRWPLLVRTREEGDRFLPLGLSGHSQKLSDFMINEKIPRRARDGWPLVCSGDEIIWVAGFRSSQPYQITGKSETAVRLSLERTDETRK